MIGVLIMTVTMFRPEGILPERRRRYPNGQETT
jgi:ABC-type branched-subunit amino acid transport system permease subunit